MNYKFAIPFNSTSPYLKDAGELIIKYHQSDNLNDFLQEHDKQRIVIDVATAATDDFFTLGALDILQAIAAKNWVLRFHSLSDDQLHELTLRNIPYFLEYFCATWESLNVILNSGVTDVYVTNQLAFSLDRVKPMAIKAGVKVRVVPNRAQSWRAETADIKKFWIRPEDIIDYDPFVDVFEIEPLHQQVSAYDIVAFKAYAIDRSWFGNIKELIVSFNDSTPIDSKYLHPNFSTRRVQCQQKCLQGKPCKMCDVWMQLGANLEKANLTVNRPIDRTKEADPNEAKEKIERAKQYQL